MSRSRGLLLPLLLIAIGVVVLLANAGVLSQAALQRLADLWPLLLVILGLQLILNHTLPRQQATLVGLAVAALIVIGALGYAALAPPTASGTRHATFSGRLGSLTAATLDITYGGATIDVRGGAPTDSLYQADIDYPAGEDPPAISLDQNGTVEIRESSSIPGFHIFGSNRRQVTVRLSGRVPWSIHVGGGAANLHLDLGELQLAKLNLSGGANRLDAQLGTPKGTVPVDVSGGASDVTLHAPAGSQWRVVVSGGVSAVTINGSSAGSLGGDFQRQSPGYDAATDRYDIQISGGASHVDFKTG